MIQQPKISDWRLSNRGSKRISSQGWIIFKIESLLHWRKVFVLLWIFFAWRKQFHLRKTSELLNELFFNFLFCLLVDLSDFDLEQGEYWTMIWNLDFWSPIIYLAKIVITAEEDPIAPSRHPLLAWIVINIGSFVIFICGIECQGPLGKIWYIFAVQWGLLKLIELS